MNLLHWGHGGFWTIPSSCCGLLWLLFTIYAIVNIMSSRASPGAKVVWIVIIVAVPYLGALLWLVVGPRQYSY